MNPIRCFVCLLFMVCVACAAPLHTTRTDDQSGTVLFDVHPGEAHVFVDGQEVGLARDFRGTRAVLKLAPGSHRVVVQHQGRACARDYYISDTQEVLQCDLTIEISETP